MKQIHLIHGFLEQKGGNLSGMETLKQRIKAECPDAFVADWEQGEFDNVSTHTATKVVLVGRSWGAAAAFRYIDTHPNLQFDLLVVFDPVANPFKKPRQWPCHGWARRPNLKYLLSFCESESVLKGSPVADEMGQESTKVIMENGIIVREAPWFKEYTLPNDPATTGSQEFFSHFTISTNQFCVDLAVKAIGAV